MIKTDLFQTVALYPNPAKTQFNLEFGIDLPEDLQWRIVNLNGVTISAGELPAGMKTHNINVDHLANGLYNIMLTDDNTVFKVLKLIVLR